MLLLRPIAVVLFIVGASLVSHAQDDKKFPTKDEIQLLLIQTDRAMQQYKPLIDQEEFRMGKSGAEAVAKDRQVVHAIEIAGKALKGQPQGFNGPGGFALFEWLDDASRNALLCSTTTLLQSTAFAMTGETSKATELLHLAQSCMDVASLIYTVSENAGALYLRYVQAEEETANEGLKVAQKCADTLKKMDAANKKRNQ